MTELHGTEVVRRFEEDGATYLRAHFQNYGNTVTWYNETLVNEIAVAQPVDSTKGIFLESVFHRQILGKKELVVKRKTLELKVG